jgi:cyanate permease
MSAGSLSGFNPTIVSQLGWTRRRAQVMTIPVWITGIVGALLTSLITGRLNKRYPAILLSITCSMIGWVIHFCQVEPPAVRYFAQFLISFGTFIQMPLYIGLLTSNIRGRAFLSYGTALQFGLGNCANFVASNVFITTQAPRYPVGFATGLSITLFAYPLMLLLVVLFSRHNKMIDSKIAALRPGEELDDQVDYKYVY